MTGLQDGSLGCLPAWRRSMADAGWLGILPPESVGGSAATMLEAAIVCEELGAGPVPGPFLMSSVVAASLLLAAPPSPARDEVLSGVAGGDVVLAPVLHRARCSWDGVEPIDAVGGSPVAFPFVPYVEACTHLPRPGLGRRGSRRRWRRTGLA